jgi:threonine dehydratase
MSDSREPIVGEPDIDPGAARRAIEAIVDQTPVLFAAEISETMGAEVWLKLENMQRTGSFKVRGAANRMLSLSREQQSAGVVTCSSGNHGKAVAYVASRLGIDATVCVPEWVDPTKLDAIQRYGARTVLHGSTYDEAEEKSFQIEREQRLTYVHPFDDPRVIAGQGTIALELHEQVPQADTLIVPLSGGGLIAGIALGAKAVHPGIRIVAVSAERARVMYESLQAGRPIEYPEEDTVARALSGGIGLDNRHSFRLVRDHVDEYVLVTEEEIRAAMRHAALDLKQIVEGGGAVGIAAVRSGKVASTGGAMAIVVSGGNIDLSSLLAVISE